MPIANKSPIDNKPTDNVLVKSKVLDDHQILELSDNIGDQLIENRSSATEIRTIFPYDKPFDDILERIRNNDSSLTKLDTFDLLHYKIGKENVLNLAAALEKNTVLTSLSLSDKGIREEGARVLATALEKNTALTSLGLSNCYIGNRGADALAVALERSNVLKFLELSNNYISAEGARALAAALEKNTALTSLSLSSNPIGDQGARAIAVALEKNNVLTSLYLLNTDIEQEGARALAAALEKNTALTSLVDINFAGDIREQGAQALVAALRKNNVLTSLNLDRKNIGEKGAQLLAAALEKNTALTSVRLVSNNIGDGGARIIAAALKINATLKSLDLGTNDIGDQGALALAAALEKNTGLTSLTLSSNTIGDQGARALAAALEKNTVLQLLELEFNKIVDQNIITQIRNKSFYNLIQQQQINNHYPKEHEYQKPQILPKEVEATSVIALQTSSASRSAHFPLPVTFLLEVPREVIAAISRWLSAGYYSSGNYRNASLVFDLSFGETLKTLAFFQQQPIPLFTQRSASLNSNSNFAETSIMHNRAVKEKLKANPLRMAATQSLAINGHIGASADQANHPQSMSLVAYTNYSHNDNSHIPYDTGAWDELIYKHPQTGEPVFIYRLFQNGKEVASASFYKHPLLCRSEQGDRHNIIATTGLLANFAIDAATLEEVCASLPPTLFDRVITSAAQGAQHGVVRGIANVVGFTLTAHQVPEQISTGIQRCIQYGGYFLLRCHSYLSQEENSDWPTVFNATIKAACDTGSMLVMSSAVNWLSKKMQQIAHNAQQKGHAHTSRLFGFFSKISSYGVYAYDASQRGAVEVASSVIAGGGAQAATEYLYHSAVKRLG